MKDHNNSSKVSFESGQSKDSFFQSQTKILFNYLQDNTATASMVADATGIAQKNICRYKRRLQTTNNLWEVKKAVCEKTGFSAWYLTTDPSKAPKESNQLNLF